MSIDIDSSFSLLFNYCWYNLHLEDFCI